MIWRLWRLLRLAAHCTRRGATRLIWLVLEREAAALRRWENWRAGR